MSKDYEDIGYLSVSHQAEYYVAASLAGYERWGKFDETTRFGKTTGYVYFVGIGKPYTTHVKIGFTSKNPFARMKDLQTGCPFVMEMLGYILGNMEHESELHRVLAEYRQTGEWFEYSDYVRQIINSEMLAEMP